MSRTCWIFNIYTFKPSVTILANLLTDDADSTKSNPNHMRISMVYWIGLSASPLFKFKRCLRNWGTNLTDDTGISKKFWSFCWCSAMSASSVSLFPDDADSAKTYLAVKQTVLRNLWIRITRRIWPSRQNRSSQWPGGPKGTVLL
jgi:hypothetical protein